VAVVVVVVGAVLVDGTVVLGVVSVVAGVVSVVVGVMSVVVASVDVGVLSVLPVISDTIPRAPEASIPALSRATNAKKIPARRSVFRPFISPAPLLLR
jgi:hypothetical protein